MTKQLASTAPISATDASTVEPNRPLLTAGLVAGPAFMGLAVVQALTRAGFDIRHHPISALTLGDGGWVQIASFVGSGLLTIAFAVGVRRTLRGDRGSNWGPMLLAGWGLGLVIAGLFVPDPAFGFPQGAPPGMPTTFSTHAQIHGLGFMLAVGSLVAATVVFARRFAGQGRRVLVGYSLASGLGILALAAGPAGDGASLRYAIAAGIGWAWVTLLASRLLVDRAAATKPYDNAH